MKSNVQHKPQGAAAWCRARVVGFKNLVVATTVGPRGLFGGPLRLLRNLPTLSKRAGAALLGARPSERAWTLLVGVIALVLGGFLVRAPARELATGKDLGLAALLTLSWLATGSALLAGGLGIILRLPSYRRFLKLGLVCSLPMPAAFGYQTFKMAVKMRSASESVRAQLEPWVSGGVQLTLFFLAVTAFLIFLLRFRLLRFLPCSGAILSSRAGPVIGGALGAAVGSGVAYLVWLLFRWLGFSQGIQWFSDSVHAIPVDYFVACAALLCAMLFAYRAHRRRARRGRFVTQAPAQALAPAPGPPAAKKGA